MKFISAEEFLKQDKEIQRVFDEWWQPEKCDIYFDLADTSAQCIHYLGESTKLYKSYNKECREEWEKWTKEVEEELDDE